MLRRWELRLDYIGAPGEDFDFEQTINIFDRHDKFVEEKTCKMVLHSITLETHPDRHDPAPETDLAVQEMRALFESWRSVETDFANLATWSTSGRSLLIRCSKCRSKRTVVASEYASIFGHLTDLDEAKGKLRCRQCGTRGKATLSPLIDPISSLAG